MPVDSKVDLATLRFIVASRVLAVRLPREPLDAPFALWAGASLSLWTLREYVGDEGVGGPGHSAQITKPLICKAKLTIES